MAAKVEQPGISFKPEDILSALFRRKWLVLFGAAVGVVAAGAMYVRDKPKYASTAKLLVRYVMDSRTPTPKSDDRQIIPLNQGASIVASEIEILMSWDLALRVADAVGPDKVLAASGGGSDRNAAAEVILSGLTPAVPPPSSIITVTCEHSDPDMAQLICKNLIEQYMQRHLEIHREVGMFDFLTQQTDLLRTELKQTEADLRALRQRSGIISLDETKKDIIVQALKVRESIQDAEELLDVQRLLQEQREKFAAGETNAPPPEAEDEEELPPDEVKRYRFVCERLLDLQRREREYVLKYTEENPLLAKLREDLALNETIKEEMETANPKLLLSAALADPKGDPLLASAQMAGTKAKIAALNLRLDRVKAEVTSFDSNEVEFVELQRKRDLEEAHFRYFSESLQRARFDSALDSGKMSNISVAQNPSPGRKTRTRLLKSMSVALAGCVGAGIGLALLLELFLDPTLKHSWQVEARAPFPLLVSIPFTRLARARRRKQGEGEASPESLWPAAQALRAYFEALRDRLVLGFGSAEGKPKVLGVTACAKGAGVSTVAAGTAIALSQESPGGVLLIDISGDRVATHCFRQGAVWGSSATAEGMDHPQTALVQQSLYFLSDGARAEALSMNLVQRMAGFLPELRKSNFDYVILDMPPISENTAVLRLGGYLEKVVLVIEAEKTHRESIQRVGGLLLEGEASVAGVFNKTRNYGPAWLNGRPARI